MLSDVYHHSRKTLCATAAQIVGCRDAEDVLHDAFVRALESRATFRGDASQTTWVRKIVINTAINERRRTCRRLGVETAAVLDESRRAVRLPLTDRLCVRAALSSLRRRDQEVLLLYDVLGWTHAEIATRLHIKAGTAKWRLFEARARLHRRLVGESKPQAREPTPLT